MKMQEKKEDRKSGEVVNWGKKKRENENKEDKDERYEQKKEKKK